jgi:DNA-binding beta-propeller fold protein YncE
VPNSVAINSAGTLLFVTYTYISAGASSLNPSSGALVVYPINSDGSLGTPVGNGAIPYYTLTSNANEVLTPVAIKAVTASGSTFVYVVAQNATGGTGSVVAFSAASSGSLTPVLCSSKASACNGDGAFDAGMTPNAIASTPLGNYIYVTDGGRNRLLSFNVESSGQLVPTLTSSASTDVFPDGVTVDPRGEYVYVANYNANDITAYSINPSASSGLTALGTYGTGSGPTCVLVEPATGNYVYTTNFLDSNVSGLNLVSGGTLAPVQNTPFLAVGQPTCIAATSHGTNPAFTASN